MYQRYVNLAGRMFEQYGSSDASLVQPAGDATFNPATGQYTGGGDDVTVNIKAIFRPVSTNRIDNQNVLADDLVVKIASAGLLVTPEVGDKITRGDETYSILAVRKIKPADTAIIFECDLRAD